MSETVIIILPSVATGMALWGRLNGEALIESGRGPLTGQADIGAKTGDVIVIVPGQSVRIHEHNLPPTAKRDRINAAGFSVEDKLGVSLDDVHLALGHGEDKRIAVMSKPELTTLLQNLGEIGIFPDQLYADFDVMDVDSKPVTILDRIVHPGPLGYAVDASWADPSVTVATISDETVLKQVATHIQNSTPLNLLQNGFRGQSQSIWQWKSFARLGALAACAYIAALFYQAMDARALGLQADDIKSQTAALYTEATGQPAPANPALAVTRAIKSNSGDNTAFLRLSSTLFQSVSQIDGLSIDRVQYQRENNELQLRLLYPSFESASEFEAAVRAAGGTLVTGGVREQSGQFIGEAVLGGGAS